MRERYSWVPPKDLDYPSRKDNNLWTKTDFYDETKLVQYATVFYYAILTMVGNEISPRSSTQTIVSIFIIITGAIVSAFIFGNMAALMEQINKKSAHFDEELDLVNGIMKHMKLPEKMQDDVVNFMFHVQTSPDMHHDLESFFSILNDPLRKQILYHLYSSIIHKVELFQKCSSIEQSFFITRFKSVLFMPGDQICKEGERGDKLYFLNKGCVAVSITQKTVKASDVMRENGGGGRYKGSSA